MRAPLLLLILAAGLALAVAIANPNVHPPVAAAPAIASDATPAVAAAPAGDAAVGQLVLQRCGTCHGLQVLSQNPQDAAGWQHTMGLMQALGAQVTPDESSQIVAYLARHFPATH